MREILLWVGIAIAAYLYRILIRGVLNGDIKQSLATWGLWGVLDCITLASIIVQHGNWLVLAFYVIGSLAVCGALAYTKQFGWTWFETGVVGLVLVCVTVWYFGGAMLATVAGTLAIATATLPQLRDSYRMPDRGTVRLWVGFTIVNFLSLVASKSLAIQEVFYPAICVGLTFALVFVNLRRR